jgi:hypothetical protein
MPLKAPAPRRFAVLVLDLLVTATVISAVLAALLPEAGAAAFKARFVDVLYAMSAERATLIERHAVTGSWTGEASEDPPNRGHHVTAAGGSIAAAGTLSGRKFAAGMRPALADPASHWSVLWLCGARQPPAGWAVTAAGAPVDLPEELVPSVCRKDAP